MNLNRRTTRVRSKMVHGNLQKFWNPQSTYLNEISPGLRHQYWRSGEPPQSTRKVCSCIEIRSSLTPVNEIFSSRSVLICVPVGKTLLKCKIFLFDVQELRTKIMPQRSTKRTPVFPNVWKPWVWKMLWLLEEEENYVPTFTECRSLSVPGFQRQLRWNFLNCENEKYIPTLNGNSFRSDKIDQGAIRLTEVRLKSS